MSLFKSIKDMDHKFSWSFLGFLVAIIVGSITFYLEFIKENQPDLNFIISADTGVLDIKEKLGKLDVLYQGTSLSKNKQDLRLITFEVINQGDTAILSNFYDANDPVGFNVINGKIADIPVLVEASNDYLKNKLLIEKKSENTVIFSNVILEPGEYFKIKILVLHNISNYPTIEAFGKIAGVNKIDIFEDYTSVSKRSFLEITFGGGVYSNITRFFAFGFSFIILFVIIFAISEQLESMKEKMRKNKLLEVFKEYDSNEITEKDNFFFDYFLSNDAGIVMHFRDLLHDQEKLNTLANETPDANSKKRHGYLSFDSSILFSELLSEGFISITNGNPNTVTVDKAKIIVLNNFFNFLKRKGEFKKSRSYIGEDYVTQVEEP